MFGLMFVTVLAPCFCVCASNDTTANQVRKDLQRAAPAELPAKAAVMVSQANPADKPQLTQWVIAAVAQTRPASLVPVVGSIATLVPEVAVVAASEGLVRDPKPGRGPHSYGSP